MQAKRLPARKQRARIIQNVGGVLKEGVTGWITPNKESKQPKDTVDIPDYIFRPDANPELSFLVFTFEVKLILETRK